MSTRRVRSTQAKTTVVLQGVQSYILPHDGRDPRRVQWSTPGTGTPWALWRRGRGRHGGLLGRSVYLVRTRLGRCRDGRRGRRWHGRDSLGHDRAASGALSDGGYRATGTPPLPRLAPRQGGHPERLGPTKGRTITLLAQLRGKRVHGRNRFRAQPDLYGQFHTTAESSWRWDHPARLFSVISC
jgi:hypothetical protein